MIPTEYQEQVALAEWLDRQGYIWTHVPNATGMGRVFGARMNKLGRKKGFPDILIFGDKTQILHIAIELKRRDVRKSRVTREQKDWIECLQRLDWHAYVCYGAANARKAIKSCSK